LSGVKFDFECKYHCLATCAPAKTAYCLAKALVNAQRGVLDLGFAPCGANAYRIDRIVTVKQLIGELVDQAATILNSAPAKA
jgi:nitronate monooxygenase